MCIFVAAMEQQFDYEVASSHHTRNTAIHKLKKPHSLEDLYIKGNILGEGQFVVVRNAVHWTSGKEYALKSINRAKVFGREDIVENELKIMRSVNRSNIIKMIEDFESDDEITLVMESMQVCSYIYYISCVYCQ